LDWLSPVDFSDNHNDLIIRRQGLQGTGRWFLESPEFKSWVDGQEDLLYCTGIPGCGKTMLSSTVVEHLRELYQDIPLAFIYCDYGLKHEHTHSNIVSCMLKQFLQYHTSCPEEIKTLYRRHSMTGRALKFEDKLSLLYSLISGQGRAFLVLDALDEYSDSDFERKALIDRLIDLSRSGTIKIMITARPNAELRRKYDMFRQLEIQANEDDIRLYLEIHMKSMSFVVQENPGLQRDIADGICRAAEGM
jgi:Cdc6-like AAA superfamily ATPase